MCRRRHHCISGMLAGRITIQCTDAQRTKDSFNTLLRLTFVTLVKLRHSILQTHTHTLLTLVDGNKPLRPFER